MSPRPTSPALVVLALCALAAAMAGASWLGWQHLALGTLAPEGAQLGLDPGCALFAGDSCDALGLSGGAIVGGVPLAWALLPLGAAGLWLGGVGLWRLRASDASPEGDGAWAGLVVSTCLGVVAALALVGVGWVEHGGLCAACVVLAVLELAAAALVVRAVGPRLGVPAGLDLVVVLLVLVGGTTGAQQVSKALASSLVGLQLDATVGEPGREDALPRGLGAPPWEAAPAVGLDSTASPPAVQRDDPAVGLANSAVRVVVTHGYDTEADRRLAGKVAALEARYRDRVRFVHKHDVRGRGECARDAQGSRIDGPCRAAVATVCAHGAARYWAFHDVLLQDLRHQDARSLVTRAEGLGLDGDAFAACLDDAVALYQVLGDHQALDAIGAPVDPAVYIDRTRLGADSSMVELTTAVESALGEGGAAQRVLPRARARWNPELRWSLLPGQTSAWIATRPLAAVGASGAAQACASVGARLCSDAEWLSACQGVAAVDDDLDGDPIADVIEGNLVPYGRWPVEGACAAREDGTGIGPRPWCATAAGVHDLVGDGEWVAGAQGLRLLGADVAGAGSATCVSTVEPEPAGLARPRCCASGTLPQPPTGGAPPTDPPEPAEGLP